MQKLNTRKLVLAGILSALVFVVTSFTMIRFPFALVKEGYFHAGDSIIFLSGLVLGGPMAAIAGGLGSFFADLYLGAPLYMFATLIIKGIMGGIAGHFLYFPRNKDKVSGTFLGLFISGIWMAFAYYFYDVIFLGIDWIANLPNLVTNFAQAAVGMLIYLPLSRGIVRIKAIFKSTDQH
jgi:uncharacterized membrane protein